MDSALDSKFMAVSIFTTLVMLRLSLMRAKPFHNFHPHSVHSPELGTLERTLLFASVVVIMGSGYFMQPAIESFLFSSDAESLKNAATNWPLTVLTALVPGSITAYAIISADNQQSKWLRGCVTSIVALTAFDFCGAIQGGISFRSFLFSFLCNTIGGPIGVVIVLTAQARLRRFHSQ
jgi:hypothetical protein